jgi:pimeloyl-ACP methyl ester carboxylesterase
MRRAYADGPFGQIHYCHGTSGRPVVMLHQAPMTSRQFDAVYPLMAARGFRPIGIDAPGFGQSASPDFVPTIDDWARVVVPVLTALHVEKTDVVGHHTGALVAAAFCIGHPELVRSLVLHGLVLPTDEERKQRLEHFAGSEQHFVYREDGAHLTEVFMLRKRMHGGPRPDPKLLTRYVVEQFMGTGEFWHGHHAAYQYDLAAVVPRLPHRTLVMSNTGDVLHQTTLRIAQLRPDLRIEILSGGGVDIVDEQPSAWASVVCDYLDEES